MNVPESGHKRKQNSYPERLTKCKRRKAPLFVLEPNVTKITELDTISYREENIYMCTG